MNVSYGWCGGKQTHSHNDALCSPADGSSFRIVSLFFVKLLLFFLNRFVLHPHGIVSPNQQQEKKMVKY